MQTTSSIRVLIAAALLLICVAAISAQQPASPQPVYVIGAVAHPGIYAAPSQPSLLRVLVAVGGLLPEAAPEKTEVRRIGPNGERQILVVDVRSILDGNAPDVALHAFDSITIPRR
jgi:protein involved in polysaccharide export with SLBB domain